MKKYYIGFAVLMTVVLASFIYAVSQASASKTDRETNQAVENISTKLDSYSTSSGVPESLLAANIKDVPDTVKYTKLSSTQYKICLSYKTAATGFDASWTGLLLGGLNGGQSTSGGTDNSYFNPAVETNHKKGQNCQTVTPYSFNSGNYGSSSSYTGSSGSLSSSPCSYPSSSLKVSGDVTVSKVDTASKTIYFQPAGQYLYDYTTNADVPMVSSKLYDSNTLVCDGKTVAKTDISAVKAGGQITIYLKSASDTTISQIDTTYLFGN